MLTPAVGMCDGDANGWGGKCTIDAKRLWTIFYIEPELLPIKVGWAELRALPTCSHPSPLPTGRVQGHHAHALLFIYPT